MTKKEAWSNETTGDEKTLSTVFTNFASTTSAHGLLHVVKAKTLITKLIWICISLAAWSMFFYMISLLIKDYRKRPVSTSINIKQERELKFPSVMVCNHNMLRKSSISSSMMTSMTIHANDSAITSMYATNAVDETMMHPHPTASTHHGTGPGPAGSNWTAPVHVPISDVDTNYVQQMNVLENLNNMDRSNLILSGHSFDSFVAYCNWKGVMCHKGYFKKYWTKKWNYMYGNCYVFNNGRTSNGTVQKPLYINNIGSDNALILELDIEQTEYQESSNVESGVRVLLSDQDVFLLPVEEGFSVAPGVSASIAMKRYEIRRDDPFNNGTCKKERIGPENHVYTIQRCSQLCRLKRQAAKCNCTSLKYTSTHRTCSTALEKICASNVEKLYQNGSLDCTKECPQPCRETRYNYVTTSSQIFVGGFKKALSHRSSKIFPPGYVKDNFVRLKIFYEDQNVEYIITRTYYGFEKLMSDIGGQLGFWIGVSVVTCCELLGFLYNILAYSLKMKRTKVQGSGFIKKKDGPSP